MTEINTKLVGDIKGEFLVPAYQRGYRWKEEVEMLLKDIDEIKDGKNYCLQPIVVKSLGEKKYELIDGQQRLTTIFLIFRYIRRFLPKIKPEFTISYETRTTNDSFLESIDFDNFDFTKLTNKKDITIDEYFFVEAANIIINRYGKQTDETQIAIDITTKLNKQIHIIWYEVDTNERSVPLFTRLNIGRIPLTNAELVKALFLSRNNALDDRKQLEIATSWDIIEKELRDNSFWYFITNERAESYSTRIELIFNLIANKQQGEREKFFTFFYFDRKIKESNNKADIWTGIQRYFQRLKEWYENIDLYHKIGYLVLVASEAQNLQNLIKSSENITKTEFQNSLDQRISKNINIEKDYGDLSYETDYSFIKKLLLLFNVETVRQNQDETARFPFDKYKQENWSLEHIHAQQSQGLSKKEQWVEWLKLHKESLLDIDKEKNEALIQEMTDAVNDEKLTGDKFLNLFEKVTYILSEEGSFEYTHSLSNMALLTRQDNSALNNSAFDVKRNKILEMDKAGDYIPVCTRRVFLKYYTQSQSNQLHFWGEADRDAYIDAMNKMLENYLKLIDKEIKS